MMALAFSITSSLALFKSPNDVKSVPFAAVVGTVEESYGCVRLQDFDGIQM